MLYLYSFPLENITRNKLWSVYKYQDCWVHDSLKHIQKFLSHNFHNIFAPTYGRVSMN